jgi:hypothetical protein
MPNLTLRLTDEEHSMLFYAAKQNRRSLQREIIYRLFEHEAVDEIVELIDGAGNVRATVPADPHFKPHPKKP